MLRIEIRRSRWLLLLLGLAHAAALALAISAGLPAWAKLMMVALVSVSGIHSIALHALQALSRSTCALEISDDCAVQARDGGGEWWNAQLLPSTFVTPWLTILNLHIDGKRLPRHVILLPDRVDADQFRRLRVWLRWRCGTPVETTVA